MVSERGLEVLHAIVKDFVSSNEPVGSKAIVERHQFGVSAATIRNDMTMLEEEQLIVAPHPSAGRIPTDKGYRLFVDTLPRLRQLSEVQRRAISSFLYESNDIDDMLNRTVRLLAQLTNQTAVVQYPRLVRATVRHLELLEVAENRILAIVIFANGVVEQQLVRLAGYDPTEDWLQGVRERIGGIIAGEDSQAAIAALESFEN